MFILHYKDNTRHSAWASKLGAIKQAEVLAGSLWRKKGYYIFYDPTVHCEDGHYYV